jgi:hypothetical protein
MAVLELGKTYPLADGSGTGTVFDMAYWVRISRPGKRHDGECRQYSPDGKFQGMMATETPALMPDRPCQAPPREVEANLQ